ncbi:SH2 domain protein [Teladorsagia circumcincta]|uniref:SH2 domain protein n=1 Tax=Teladorsagia circumcincta TaxID=45464 RepID=A0A2G9UAI9_TELCI|nr:SH2 domain protein [Teladorsagia circumcincta]
MAGGQLSDQIWYWGNVDKSMVSEIMQDQPEGTFMVRDASSPGDYTLTVRFGGHTKLVRIHVYKGRCGFALESLTHDSVVSLIEFYRTRSLKCYNAQLDVCLKYPLPRRKNSVRAIETVSLPASVSPPLPAFNPDWELRLGLERLRIYQTSVDRAARLFDAVHEEKKMADDLHYEYTQAVDLDRKVKQLEDVLSTLQSCRESNDETDPKRVHTFKANSELVEKSIKKLKEEREFVVDRRARVAKIIEDLEQASAHAKERLVSCHNTRNQSYTELYKKGVPKHKLGETIEHATSMLEKETMQASELLADIPLTWEPEQ